MAFKISQVGKHGVREKSVLIQNQSAVISADDTADFQAPLAAGTSITIAENINGCSLNVEGGQVVIRNEKISGSTFIRNSCNFSCGDSHFYVTTVTNDQNAVRHKKGYLTTLALVTIWALLITQVVVPIWLPYKITVHEVKGRNVLIENCSRGIDSLRNKLKEEMGQVNQYPQTIRNIIVSLNEEVEQIAWTFRNASDFMSAADLQKLESHIAQYIHVLSNIKQADTINISPLSTDSVLKPLLSPDEKK